MATKIIAVRAPLSHREASYGHPQGASGGAGAPKQKPRQGRGQVWNSEGACRVATPGKPTDTIPQSVAQRAGDFAAVDKITLHVAARQH